MREFAIGKLKELGFDPNVISRYDEPQRIQHNWNHIEDLLHDAKKRGMLDDSTYGDSLFTAIIFHDAVYDPRSKTNEEDSANLYLNSGGNNVAIYDAILDTKKHVLSPENKISKKLCWLDTKILYSDFKTFVDFEDRIFKEFQFIDLNTYIDKRVKLLGYYHVSPEYLNYIKYRKYNIGVYAGSFNPFHKGHYNILSKAEKIFDKVIIIRGVNLQKNNVVVDMPDALKYHQVEYYEGLTTDFITNLGYDVTLIRGLRNSTDLQLELTQYRYLQDLKPNIKVASIFCDREFEHISSSSIRELANYGKGTNYLI